MSLGRIVLFSGVDNTYRDNWPDDVKKLMPWMPLSLLTVGSYLQAAGYEVLAVDPQVDKDWRRTIRSSVAGSVYFGVTCLSGPSIKYVLQAVSIARATDDTVPVVWGGYHATLAYRSILREGVADVSTIGPGEPAALALARVFANHRRGDPRLVGLLEQIPGVAYLDGRREVGRDGGSRARVVATGRSRVGDMNELPPFDYELLPPPSYFTPDERKLPYISSYGCPYACTYCSEPTNSGRQWRPLDPARVVREAEQLTRRYAPGHVDFMDPNFSTDPRRVVDFVEQARRSREEMHFMCNMRARDVVMIGRRTDLRRLAEAGFTRIFIGVETASNRLLTELRKNATAEDTLVACQLLGAAGIEFHTSFMHDLPTETVEDSEASLELAARLATQPGNFQSHHFYMPFAGTELFDSLPTADQQEYRTQDEWANSSTKGSSLWPGRRDFRLRVIERLSRIKEQHPAPYFLTSLPTVDPAVPSVPGTEPTAGVG